MSQPAANARIALSPAFVELVKAHTPRVWRFLRYQGVPEVDLPDASQDVFLVVYRRLSEFRGDAKVTTWLYEICLRVALARRRKSAARREDIGVVEDGHSVPPGADASDARRVLATVLEQLPEEQRAVVVLHEIEELEMAEVARVLGCPRFTAYSRLRLARRKLRQLLGAEREGAGS